jgi:DNA-binding PadR family transcriptional regulator
VSDYLGEFEHLVLLALMRLGRDAYAIPIRATIRDRAGRDVSLGAVYSTLRRLEEKGYVHSRSGDPEPVRGGRAKKYFELTPTGLLELRQAQERLARMAEGMEGLRLAEGER